MFMLQTIFRPYTILRLVLINDIELHHGNFHNLWGSLKIIFSYYVSDCILKWPHYPLRDLNHCAYLSNPSGFLLSGIFIKGQIIQSNLHKKMVYITQGLSSRLIQTVIFSTSLNQNQNQILVLLTYEHD